MIKKYNLLIDSLSKKIGLDLPYFIKNGFWTIIRQSGGILCSAALSIVFARMTTREVYGSYQFLISTFMMVSVFSMPGLGISALRSTARGYDGVFIKSVRLSFLWSFFGSIVLILIGSYYYFNNNIVFGYSFLVSSLFFPFIYGPNNWTTFLKAKKRFDLFSIYAIARSVLNLVVILIAIFLSSGNVLVIFISYLLSWAFSNVFFYFIIKNMVANKNEDENWIKGGYKLTLLEVINLFYDNGDKILIGIFLGPVQLAIYSIASNLTRQIRSVFKEYIILIFPKILNMKLEKVKNKIIGSLAKVTALSAAIALTLSFIMPYLVRILYSDKYEDSIFYAQLYMITIPLFVILNILSFALIAVDLENKLIKIKTVAALANVGLYFILIPFWGIIGAIVSSIVYCMIMVLAQIFYLRRCL